MCNSKLNQILDIQHCLNIRLTKFTYVNFVYYDNNKSVLTRNISLNSSLKETNIFQEKHFTVCKHCYFICFSQNTDACFYNAYIV